VTYSTRPTHAARQAHARGDRQFRTYDTTFIQPRRSKGPTVFAIVLCALVVIGLLLFFVSCSNGCSSNTTALVADGTEVTVTIADGASTSAIASTLQSNGLISSTSDFTKAVQSQGAGSSLKPGTYKITGGTSIADIIVLLEAGPANSSLVIPEGYTIAKIASTVATVSGGRITADQFSEAANNASAYAADYPFVSDAYNNSLEGFLFPKTYKLEDDDTADSLVRKMLTQYQTEVTSLDYSYATSKNLTSYDILILASIIEREATSDVRSQVSSVFYNRLAAQMPLQSDATVAYVVNGDPTPEDLQTSSPYNTYLNYGLPAGPICSPGIESLKAACKPDQTNYLYFYFTQNDDGTMNYSFSETYEEHQDAIGGTTGTTGASEATPTTEG
jgi:UPF0755 protein